MTGGMSLEERIQFDTQGYVVWPEVLEPGLVKELNDLIERHQGELIEGFGFDYNVGDDLGAGDFQLKGGAIKSINNIIALDDLFFDLALHPQLFPKMADVWDGNIRLLGTDYLASPPGARPSLGWHNDVIKHDYPSIAVGDSILRCHLLVMLTDVGPEEGPTIVLPGSHRWQQGTQLPEEWIGRTDPEALPGHVAITGRAGTAWFFNTRITHAQSPNDSDRWRRMLLYIFAHRFQREIHYLWRFPEGRLAELNTSPIAAQLLGLTPAWDEPYAPYEVPPRWRTAVGAPA